MSSSNNVGTPNKAVLVIVAVAAPVMPKVNPFAEPGQTPVYMQDEASSKSKFTAFILALFFGWIGLHNFYMGHTLRGLMQLALQVGCLPSNAYFGYRTFD